MPNNLQYQFIILFACISLHGMHIDRQKIIKPLQQELNEQLLREASTCIRSLEISRLLKEGAHINTQDSNGNTPVHLFIDHYLSIPINQKLYYANNGILKELLIHNPNISLQNNTGKTALHIAVGYHDFYICNDLVAYAQNCDKEIQKNFKIAETLFLINKRKKIVQGLWFPKPLLFLIINQVTDLKLPKRDYLCLKTMLNKETNDKKTAFAIVNEQLFALEEIKKIQKTETSTTNNFRMDKKTCIVDRKHRTLKNIKKLVNPDNPNYK